VPLPKFRGFLRRALGTPRTFFAALFVFIYIPGFNVL
jgi:hypothetical protein